MGLNILQLDPFSMTPYYNDALCRALTSAGCMVRYVTSPFLYDPSFLSSGDYRSDILYFRHLNYPWLVDHLHLRRMSRLLFYWSGHQQLLHSLRVERPDVVHVQWSRFPLLDLPLIHHIQAIGIPVVHTVHDVEPLFQHAQVASLAKIYSCADRLIVHARANRQALVPRYSQIYRDHVRVIPHISLNTPAADSISGAKARAILQLPKNAVVILFFGSIRTYKALDDLIEAFLQARTQQPDLWIIIAGRPEHPGMASSAGKLNDHAIVRLEYIPASEVELYHRAADVAVFPYQRISQSGALITAMGFGLSVIVSDLGAMPETVDGNGWIVPQNDIKALTAALLDASSDLTRLRAMGERSLHLINERHSPTVVAQQLVDVYQELVQ